MSKKWLNIELGYTVPYNTVVMIAKSSMMDEYQSNLDGAGSDMSSKIVEMFPLGTKPKKRIGEHIRRISEENIRGRVGNRSSQGYCSRGHCGRSFGRGYGGRHYINNIDVRDVERDFTDQEWKQ